MTIAPTNKRLLLAITLISAGVMFFFAYLGFARGDGGQFGLCAGAGAASLVGGFANFFHFGKASNAPNQ